MLKFWWWRYHKCQVPIFIIYKFKEITIFLHKSESNIIVFCLFLSGEEYDRCFVRLSGRNDDIGSVNILLPCGHGWCCDNCGQQQTNCGICQTPIDDTFSIYIMIGNGNANYIFKFNIKY